MTMAVHGEEDVLVMEVKEGKELGAIIWGNLLKTIKEEIKRRKDLIDQGAPLPIERLTWPHGGLATWAGRWAWPLVGPFFFPFILFYFFVCLITFEFKLQIG